jgi:phytoene dehydrogenase-like protein
VSRIRIDDGRAAGVVLDGGEEIAARTVVSNADPRSTFLRLVDPVHLEPDFLQRIRNYRSVGTAAKLGGTVSYARHLSRKRAVPPDTSELLT